MIREEIEGLILVVGSIEREQNNSPSISMEDRALESSEDNRISIAENFELEVKDEANPFVHRWKRFVHCSRTIDIQSRIVYSWTRLELEQKDVEWQNHRLEHADEAFDIEADKDFRFEYSNEDENDNALERRDNELNERSTRTTFSSMKLMIEINEDFLEERVDHSSVTVKSISSMFFFGNGCSMIEQMCLSVCSSLFKSKLVSDDVVHVLGMRM